MPKLRTLKPRVAIADLRRVKPPRKTGDPFYSSREWRQLLADIIVERGRRCEDPNCSTPHGPWRMIYGDHIVERADGGAELERSNIMLRCPHCHGRKTADERRKRLGPRPRRARLAAFGLMRRFFFRCEFQIHFYPGQKQEKKAKMARPSIEITPEMREVVITLAQAGKSKAKISTAVGLSKKTLRKYFADELSDLFSEGINPEKKKKSHLALRQRLRIVCPHCLEAIEFTERDRRGEVRVRRGQAP